MAMWIIVGLLAVIAGLMFLILWDVGQILESVSTMEGTLRSASRRESDFGEDTKAFALLNTIELHARRLANRHGRDGDPRDYPDYGWDNRDGPPPEQRLY